MIATFSELQSVLGTLNPWTLPTSPTMLERITELSVLPMLPQLWVITVGRHLGWAVILIALALRAGGGRGLVWRRRLAGFLMVWCVLPGSWGLAYWLGLAFQVPSLSSIGLAWLLINRPSERRRQPRSGNQRMVLAAAAAGLGWLLLLDTLAVLPRITPFIGFIYPWGYSTAALAAWVAFGLVLVWTVSREAGLAALVLAVVFVVTRLPSGNLWDALLDPWLWLFAHGVLVRGAWVAWRGPTTRNRAAV